MNGDARAAGVGSSSGIGKAVALAFATQSSADNECQTKICVMSRSKTRLQAVVDEIEKLGAEGFAVAGDLTKGSDCQSAVEEAVRGEVLLSVSLLGQPYEAHTRIYMTAG